MTTEIYLELKILDLLKFRVRGSTLPTLAKRLGTEKQKLSLILEAMVDEGKLIKKGKYYRLPTVIRKIPAELPPAPYHRILIKYSGLRISWDAVERLCSLMEHLSEKIAIEAGKNARSSQRRTVSAGDIDVATSKLGIETE